MRKPEQHTVQWEDFDTMARRAFCTGRYKAMFARVSGINRATIHRWAGGRVAVPQYAMAIVTLLAALPEDAREKAAEPLL